jgi:type III secretory pathway component EscU
MKTLGINISKEIKTAHKAWEKQRKHIENQKQIIKLFALAILLFITLSGNAQKFEKIDGIGKTMVKLETITNQFMFYGTGDLKGLRLDFYYSSEFGIIGYAFDKKDICKKIVIPTNSKRTFEIDLCYTIRKIKDTNLTIIE